MLPSGTTGKTGNQDAVEYLSRGWFPINNALLKEVQTNLKSGRYDSDRETLIRDIKSDFSLFAHCMRKLGNESDKDKQEKDPMELIRDTEIEHLKNMLGVPADSISPHVFDPKMKAQVSRVKHFLIASSAAEAMSSAKNINPDLGYSCSVARQLGMALVAYNYPRIYSQAVASLKGENDDLEKNLRKTLGYSPTQLGIKLSLGWCKNTSVRVGLGETVLPDEEDDPLMAYKHRDKEHKQGEELKKICEISEALARLNDAEHYPSSSKKWDKVTHEITQYLGPDGLEIINERVKAYQSDYVAMAPDAFTTEISPQRNVETSNSQYSAKLYAENTYIKNCHGNIRTEFEKIYKRINFGQVSSEGVGGLINNAIPIAGFLSGCVYLTEHKTTRLVPALRVGKARLSDFRALSYLDTGANTHPVVDALNSQIPIRQENVVVNGQVVSFIAGAFGNGEKSGVLYLEMSKELTEADRQVSLVHFKAIRQCLNDCLNLH